MLSNEEIADFDEARKQRHADRAAQQSEQARLRVEEEAQYEEQARTACCSLPFPRSPL